MKIPIVSSILPLFLIFMIYSIITATIAERFAYKFIDVKKP